jgi:hypothetical protein
MSTGKQASSSGSDYLKAFHTTRRFKNLLALVVALCLLGQLAAYVSVGVYGILDPLFAEGVHDKAQTQRATSVQFVLMQAMPLAKTVAFSSAGMLALALMFAAKISLVDRLGGAAGLVGAFFWSLLVLATLTPWQDIVSSTWAWGAITDYPSLLAAVAEVREGWSYESPSALSKGLHYGRMIGYPAIALVLLLMTQLRFSKGYSAFGAALSD